MAYRRVVQLDARKLYSCYWKRLFYYRDEITIH
jgi:hypothetical protein